jgi:signal recognition particle receptor subunit beta
MTMSLQRLAGASLLVFANKQDIQGSMTAQEIEQASPAGLPGKGCSQLT